ncbi:MAG: FtsW/RodA/SpoVE family cell cycle protein [Andreesenia angusta]|nr:FtsW/RodA/SpoVE family cell cycle protein [Andreesenia angusta]
MNTKYDRGIIVSTIILCILGLFMVYNTTHLIDHNKPYLINQLLATIIGIIGIIIIQKIDIEIFERLYILIYILSISILIWVLLSGTGSNEWGAQSWIRFKYFGFQPSELTKLGFILFFASYFSKYDHKINEPLFLLLTTLLLAIPIVLILLQPDFGTVIVYLFVFGIILLSTGISKRFLAFGMSILTIALPIIWLNLSDYQKKRIYVFLDPNYDIEGSGYQVFISKEAIKSSGFLGKGLLRDNSEVFLKVPENHNDFIFPSTIESFGILGGIILILLFLFLIYKIFKYGKLQENSFQKYALYGFSSMLFFHFFENIAMTIGAMPMTGIPLPFISYGGTFQLSNMLLIGLCLKFIKNRKPLSYNN